MEAELKLYKKYTHDVIWCLYAAGVWPDSHPIFKRVMSVTSFFSTLAVTISVFNFCFQNMGNVMVLAKGMGLAISFFSAFMKVCVFLMHQEDLIYLNTVLTKKYISDMQSTENHPDLLKRIRIFKLLMYTHAGAGAIAFTMYSMSPLIALKKHGKYVRAFPAIYPFSYEPGGIIHWSLFLLEAVGAFCLWTIIIGVDCAFGMYTLQTCGELRILAKKFQSLRVSDDYQRNLKECIERHHLLINVKNKMENTFGLLTIWLAVSGALVLCSLIFQVTEAAKHTENLVQAAQLCCYLIPKFVQIFMYAWYGNLIAEESGLCLDSIYDSHWPELCNTRFKNDILIILSQEPLVLIAKGCVLIQLDMFTKIVKAAVSYFCLLRTLSESD